MNCYTSHFDAK